jgi:hypothetical protein
MGAAVVGSTLGSLGIGEASADPPGCKRNGKNCTRSEQCCSGNCSSGSCQAQTTTTTRTPTTSTSTTTPTTTTTPGCISEFGLCSANDQCCNGVCGYVAPGGSSRCTGCRAAGGICAAGEPCCDPNATCVNGRCCTTLSTGCNATTPCCPGDGGCVNGACRS